MVGAPDAPRTRPASGTEKFYLDRRGVRSRRSCLQRWVKDTGAAGFSTPWRYPRDQTPDTLADSRPTRVGRCPNAHFALVSSASWPPWRFWWRPTRPWQRHQPGVGPPLAGRLDLFALFSHPFTNTAPDTEE